MRYERSEKRKHDRPSKTLGTGVHNKPQMGSLHCGFLDSFLDLLLLGVGLSQKSWVRPVLGSRVTLTWSPHFPCYHIVLVPSWEGHKKPFFLCLPSLDSPSVSVLGPLFQGETPPGQTSVWTQPQRYWRCSERTCFICLPSHLCSLLISRPSCIMDFQKSQAWREDVWPRVSLPQANEVMNE